MTSVIDEYRVRLRHALAQLQEMENELEAVRAERAEPIAILGMACRFPGNANSPEAFFKLLEHEVDTVTEVPAERWALDPHDADMSPDERSARWGAFLQDVDRFDASFFGISPREAASMDPQHRILLEVTWEALERAGQLPERLNGTNAGVFLGIVQTDYLLKCAFRHLEVLDFYDTVGNGHCFAAGRLSYSFGFNGPCVTVDTACSSSLVAIHLACQSLRLRECDLAVTGGCNLMLEPFMTRLLATSHGLSPDGRCKTLDARANGFVRGEGAGMVVLKRLSDARRDGDPILALIRGSAINQDGRSAGIAAPNVKAQEAVLQQALANAQLQPESIGYVEMHGTGTPLGDPIEAAALKAVLGKPRGDGSKCVLGAVKTNIAHLESAAGVAGFIKTVMAFERERIPKNLHFNALNPRISLKDSCFLVPTGAIAWPRKDKPRYAGVSSFGMSGTNSHVILEEAPLDAAPTSREEKSAYLLPLSAKSTESLAALAQSHAEWFSQPNDATVQDIVYTASVRRTHHDHRLAVVAHTREEFANALAALGKREAPAGTVQGRISPEHPPRVVFIFPGQGSQWVGMGRQLLVEEPAFRASLEATDAAIRQEAGFSVLDQIAANESSSRMGEIDVVQPLLFAIEVALVSLWRSWGIEPDCVVGHSMGEVAAAHVAGILDVNDAARIICRRSKLLKRISGQGAMALVELPLAEAEAALVGYESKVGIAVSNGPRSTVLSGDPAALETILAALKATGVFCRRVNINVASHSPQVAPLCADLLAAIRETKPAPAKLNVRSTVTRRALLGPEMNASYWIDNLRQPVLFSQVTRDLIEEGHSIFVEMSPHPILLPSIEENLKNLGTSGLALPSMRRQTAERRTILEALGALHVHGTHIDWSKIHPEGGRVVSLPTYAWQHERFWVEVPKKQPRAIRNAHAHPLLGQHLVPASQPELHVWEQWLSIAEFPYLADHRVQGEIVFPGAAYVEMALAAAREVHGDGAVRLETINLARMLVLPENEGRILQIALLQEGGGRGNFTISSKQEGAMDWVRHATGTVIVAATSTQPPEMIDPVLVRARFPRIITSSEHYERMVARGLVYGPAFQGITEVRLGTGEVMAQVRLEDKALADPENYGLHPALLDACFQVAAWGMGAQNNQTTFVPVKVAGVRMYQRPGRTFWVHGRSRTDAGAESPTIALIARDDRGRVLFEVGELEARALDGASATANVDPFEKCIFHVEWQKVELSPETAHTPRERGAWLVLKDEHGLGAEIAAHLRAQGQRIVMVTGADELAKRSIDDFTLNPTSLEHWERVLGDAFGKTGCQGVIHCGGLDGATWQQTSLDTLHADIRSGSLSVLRLAQALLKQGWRDVPRLYVLTRAARATGDSPTPLSVAQSMIWGLGRVIATEQPDLGCVCIDLPAEACPDEPTLILRELNSGSEEDQIALRTDGRHVARLVRGSWKNDPAGIERLEPAAGRSYRLDIRQPGVLERLALRETERKKPGPGEVEIEIEAAGLNFLDVMKAMGIYPGMDRSSIALGGECAGKISAVGQGVTQFVIGQAVLASAPFSFSSHVTIRAEFVAPKPERLSFEQAATIPAVFMTAQWALHHVGRLRRGERILIHSATGGMGLAAIQYARAVGAEIFGTAGSEEKRAFLRSIGIEHVMDSRSTQFAEEILAKTNGRGVDVVLNSLTGDALVRSLEVLAPYGRFLELGKKDIYENNRLGLLPFRKSLSYTAIDLAAMIDERPDDYGALLREVVAKFEEGTFEPEPVTVFDANEASKAFRLMAQAKHIGKIALRMRDPAAKISVSPREGVRICSDATYLITGGLGGLGLSLAKWLVNQGAKHLVLIGRHAPNDSAEKAIAEMRASGAHAEPLRADVAQRTHVDRVLAHVREFMPPLRGIVHAAAVLADRTVTEMDEAQFFEALRPKVFGAWNLHEATRHEPLDFFIMYSSGAGLLGSPGQANYAAANTFLDALGQARSACGLAGTSIQWGNFSDVGFAAASAMRGSRMVSRGGAAFATDEGNSLFARVLAQPRPEMGIMHFNVRQWMEFYPHVAGTPFFAELLREKSLASAPADENVRTGLERAAPTQRLPRIEAHIIEQLGKVLRLDPQKIDKRTPFINLGIDSLMSLELRNRLEASLGLKLSAALLFSYSTPAALAHHLAERLFPAPVTPNDVAPVPAANAEENAPSTVGTEPFRQEDESALVDKLGEFEEYLR